MASHQVRGSARETHNRYPQQTPHTYASELVVQSEIQKAARLFTNLETYGAKAWQIQGQRPRVLVSNPIDPKVATNILPLVQKVITTASLVRQERAATLQLPLPITPAWTYAKPAKVLDKETLDLTLASLNRGLGKYAALVEFFGKYFLIERGTVEPREISSDEIQTIIKDRVERIGFRMPLDSSSPIHVVNLPVETIHRHLKEMNVPNSYILSHSSDPEGIRLDKLVKTEGLMLDKILRGEEGQLEIHTEWFMKVKGQDPLWTQKYLNDCIVEFRTLIDIVNFCVRKSRDS